MSLKTRLIRLESINKIDEPAKPLVILFGDEQPPSDADERDIVRIHVMPTDNPDHVIITRHNRL